MKKIKEVSDIQAQIKIIDDLIIQLCDLKKNSRFESYSYYDAQIKRLAEAKVDCVQELLRLTVSTTLDNPMVAFPVKQLSSDDEREVKVEVKCHNCPAVSVCILADEQDWRKREKCHLDDELRGLTQKED